jgi:succinoglycan biosynthesis transport protein ExoP
MSFQDYLRVLRKRWLWLAASITLGALVSIGVTVAVTPHYTATSQIFVSPGAVSTSGELAQSSTFVQNRVKSYAQLITRDLVLRGVVEELDLPMTTQELSQQVVATSPEETVLIDITVTDSSPEQAASIANAIAAQFPEVARSIEPERSDASSSVAVTVIQEAEVPESPVSPQPSLNLALGILGGFAVGIILIALREALDTRIRNERDVSAQTDHSVLGRIPIDRQSRELVVAADPHSRGAEAFRQLRTSLQFFSAGGHEKVLLMTSSVPGEGKSYTSVNLAIALADAGLKVCLVDADLRRPSVGRYLDLEESVGLTSVLIGTADLDDALQPWGEGNLDVLASGQLPPNPSELLGLPAMRNLLDTLEKRYDIVIVDSAPLLPVTDSAVLAAACRGVVLVVGAGKIHRKELRRSLNDLHAVGAPVLGVVLNRLPTKGVDGIDMSRYGYRAADDAGGGKTPGVKRGALRRRHRTAQNRGTEAHPPAAAPEPDSSPPPTLSHSSPGEEPTGVVRPEDAPTGKIAAKRRSAATSTL